MGQVRLGRPKKPLVLSADEKEQLRGITQSRALPNGIVRRARMVLLSAGADRSPDGDERGAGEFLAAPVPAARGHGTA
jgi:hypothetical protein